MKLYRAKRKEAEQAANPKPVIDAPKIWLKRQLSFL